MGVRIYHKKKAFHADDERRYSVPFKVGWHRKGKVVVFEDGCEKEATVVWEVEAQPRSLESLNTLETNLIAAVLGTDNCCRYVNCQSRRKKRRAYSDDE